MILFLILSRGCYSTMASYDRLLILYKRIQGSPDLRRDQLVIYLNQAMNPSSPKLPFRQGSRDMQVLRSIDAKFQPQIDPRQSQALLMRLLLLSIQLDRKDAIIRELLNAAHNNQYEVQLEQLTLRCRKYEMEVKTLTETISMLKENISVIESAKNREVFNSVSHQFNQELQARVHMLEGRLRKAEDENVSLEEQVKQYKLNQSMAEYKSLRDGQSEKGRVRELQAQLMTERARAESQRKAAAEKGMLVEQLRGRLLQGQANEKMLIQQYQEKLRMFQNELIYHQSMKKSQIVTTEERATATAHENARLHEELRYLKQTLETEREATRVKDREISKFVAESKAAESRSIRLQGELKEMGVRLQGKGLQLKLKEKELSEKEGQIKRLMVETEQTRFFFNSKGEEAQIYASEVERLKDQVSELTRQCDQQRSELRRLKRKPISQLLCQGCRARETGSSSLITSQKSIKALNIEEIIHQTEQLFRSNRKVQSIITRHQSIAESSIQLYTQHASQQ